MNIDILCSDILHPVNKFLQNWIKIRSNKHIINIARQPCELRGGDILFLISVSEIIKKNIRDLYTAALVLHASDLPEGRGWSPYIWQIIEGANEITVSLLEAEDNVDAGAILSKISFNLEGHELLDEINEKLFSTEIDLMEYAISHLSEIETRAQDDRTPTYYKRRTSEDSQIDPEKSLASQFDLLRVVDPIRFPAFFNLRGHRYYLTISKDLPNE